MEKATIDFIQANFVLSVTTVGKGNKPWSANCFYAFNETNNTLIFISHGNTKHYQMLTENPVVSGTISAQTKNVLHIQGIQFTGKVVTPEGQDSKDANSRFYKRFPFARFVRAKLWVLELDHVKFTDNTLGFGKKLIWEKDQ